MSDNNPYPLRVLLDGLVSAALDAMSELQASVALADWREDGEANTEALAERLEVTVDDVRRSREEARRQMLEAGRAAVELKDWNALRRAVMEPTLKVPSRPVR